MGNTMNALSIPCAGKGTSPLNCAFHCDMGRAKRPLKYFLPLFAITLLLHSFHYVATPTQPNHDFDCGASRVLLEAKGQTPSCTTQYSVSNRPQTEPVFKQQEAESF